MENPSWDAPAGTTTCPAHSSTPVPALEIKEFFPSIKSEALASLEYHRHTVFLFSLHSTGWGSAHTGKLERWDQGCRAKAELHNIGSTRAPSTNQKEERNPSLIPVAAHNKSLHLAHRFIQHRGGIFPPFRGLWDRS